MEHFYKTNSKGKNGVIKLFPHCKKREIKRSLEWRIANRESYLKSHAKTRKTENYIKKSKEIWEKRRKEGLVKQWRQNNPDKIKEYNKRYSNKAYNISSKEWIACKEYFNYSCAYCGMLEKEHKEKYNQQLHKEHVDCNGEGNLSNCAPSCRRCNDSKHTSNMEEWYRKQKFFNQDKLNKIHKWVGEDYKLYSKIKEKVK